MIFDVLVNDLIIKLKIRYFSLLLAMFNITKKNIYRIICPNNTVYSNNKPDYDSKPEAVISKSVTK